MEDQFEQLRAATSASLTAKKFATFVEACSGFISNQQVCWTAISVQHRLKAVNKAGHEFHCLADDRRLVRMKRFANKPESNQKPDRRNVVLKVVGSILPMLALMLMAGCVTHPSPSTVQPWPDPPPDGYAMLMMYDCYRKGGSGPSVIIDNTMAFKMHGNSYTWSYIQAGQHTFRTKWNWLLSGLNINDKITIAAGTNYYMKLMVSNDGNPYVMTIRSAIRQVSEQTARKESATCWYRKPLVLRIDASDEQPEKH